MTGGKVYAHCVSFTNWEYDSDGDIRELLTPPVDPSIFH